MTQKNDNSPRIAPKNALKNNNKRFNDALSVMSNFALAGAIGLTSSALVSMFSRKPEHDYMDMLVMLMLGGLSLTSACVMQHLKRYPSGDD